VLGAGSFGITYLAFDTNLEKKVAIKEYLPAAIAVRNGTTVLPTSPAHQQDYRWGLDRFIQESRTLARFSHPHIVRVNRFFEANDTGYMVMDYEDGEPLKSYLQRNPFPSEGTLKALMAPLLDGLEKVHAADFLHRDIKPDNIFVRKSGGAVLIDFGSSRAAVGGSVQALTTIVSPGYAPFEQYTTSAEQGPWSDIYALAGVFYFAVTGQSPPDAITRMKSDTLAQGLGAARLRYSAPLVDAIAWGLALEEAKRPRTIGQWRDALFGQRVASSPGAMQVAKPQAIPTPQKPGSGVSTGGTAAGSPNADRAQRAAAIAAVLAERHETSRERSPWRWIFMTALVLGVAIIGSRMVFHREPPKARTQQPTVVILPPHMMKLQRPAQPPAPAAQPAAPADTTAPAGDSTASPTQSPVDTTAATIDASAASPTPAAPVSQRVEQRIEGKMHAADPNGLGLTREQFAQTFPRLSEHFDQLDADLDERITAQELMLGWERFWAKSAQDAQ
jgi:serine/threonine protein kinase